MNADPRDPAASAMRVALSIPLRYDHPLGDLTPFYAGLIEGVARATQCDACGRAWFPPRFSCCCGSPITTWIALSGKGKVVHLTTTSGALPLGGERSGSLILALVRLDQATNTVCARIESDTPVAPGCEVRLRRIARSVAHPVQYLAFEPIRDSA